MTRDDASGDPVVRQLREQISDNDRAIVEAINRRLKLVARLKQYKASRGFEFVDRGREDWIVRYLARANRGPLTTPGLHELFDAILELTKREVANSEEAASTEAAERSSQSAVRPGSG
jgi:chorismate mutase